MSLPKRLRREQRGFSLIELIVALAVGMVILIAALTLLDRSLFTANEVDDRVGTNQRGRLPMEIVTRALRSQVCMPADLTDTGVDDSKSALTSADNSSVTLYTNLGGETPRYERRRYSFAGGQLKEEVWSSAGTAPNLTFAVNPTRTNILATRISQSGTTPVFRYYAFANSSPPTPDLALTTPLTFVDLARVVKVDVAYKADSERAANANVGANYEDSVFVRGARGPDFSLNPPEYGGPPCG
jgi:prepilin-type N-terminal cleavage/methylation domain-containing protein